MLKSALYVVGRALSVLVIVIGFGVPMLAYSGESGLQEQPLPQLATLLTAMVVAVVAHEFGHLIACLAVGAKVQAFQIGGRQAPVRFHVGTVEVSLGRPVHGRVRFTGALSVWRRTVIMLAGALADLLVAALVLAGAAASWRGVPPLAFIAADGLAMIGLTSLMPYRTRAGELTDGAQLFELRSGVAAARLATARETAGRLLDAGRVTELLELHAGLDVPRGRLSPARAGSLLLVEYYVALLPGRLPDDAAVLAEGRASALAQRRDLGSLEPLACLTLALLLLKRGGEQRQAEAERLCERALAGKDVSDSLRRVALAAVLMSRQARGLPHADVTAAASAAMPAGVGRVAEAMAELSAAFDPEGVLQAFRHGDPAARLGLAGIATMLYRQGRVGELLELHTDFATPAGPHAPRQVRSLRSLEYHVLLLPDPPAGVHGEAARRVHWIAENYPLDREKEPVQHAAFEHTLALARLRQGRFADVEPLCTRALAASIGPDNRATVLATVALARRGLGQPYADVLAEAVALSPDADLVAEAQRSQSARQGQPQPFGTS